MVMGCVTTKVRAWAAPAKAGCGSLACSLCYPDVDAMDDEIAQELRDAAARREVIVAAQEALQVGI